ncbi:MAG: hypothetical protein UY77_C0012G0013 [Candidatus Uhrbacteria bacterium GW2011_GWA2_53_10]|uniref:Type II toxin-antitoxin system RelE/ParE family toxin n=1 Tax=Candidatus Uhrbacteria bacterium GW2011_GWA2_53_10 TaxID=1618980 RepID=A0A0G1XPH6_9BACT|nr:MAG: hypothetical protein UY77_C0012G0013 [Candidatus Uhrbacteria bacterium GW2011_GWA2_53_10]
MSDAQECVEAVVTAYDGMNIRFSHNDTEEFVERLDRSTGVKVLRVIELLEQFGHRLGMPHSRNIGGGLFELRVRGKEEVRLFYVFRQSEVVIVHGFLKKSQKIPLKELSKAEARASRVDGE